MPTIVSIASGKGGVGKSVTVSNLGLALAERGHRVVLADLDLGGGNLGTLFGAFESGPDLDQFLRGQIRDLEEVARPVRPNLRLIAGAGESLATANPNWAMKQRLLRQIRKLDADIVLLDIGAGAGHHALDFFSAGAIRVMVTLPEPTASVDAYRFLKLASAREASVRVSSRNPMRRSLEKDEPKRRAQLWETLSVEAIAPPEAVTPCVILNQASDSRQSFERLRMVSRRFLGGDLRLLGEVPYDPVVRESVANFLPLLESSADSGAGRALEAIAISLESEIDVLTKIRVPSGASAAAAVSPAIPV